MNADPGSRERTLVVLLLEKSPGGARPIRERLADREGLCLELVEVAGLPDALDRIAASPPDVVLVDLSLPGARGLDTVRTVVEAAPGLPVIVLADQETSEAASLALEAGARGCLARHELTGPLLERTLRDAVEPGVTVEAGRRSDGRFRALAESTPDAIVTIDAGSRIVYANPAAEAIFGYPSEELVGSPITRLMPDDRAEEHVAGLASYLRTGVRSIDWAHAEFRAKRADGELFPVEISFAEFTVGDERFFTGIIRDVTGRRDTERKLRESERRFRMLAEHIREAFWIRDARTSELTYVSPGFEEVWGRSVESEDPGSHVMLEAIHPDDRQGVAAAVSDIEAGRLTEPRSLRYRIVTPDGGVRWIADRAYPVADGDGELSHVVGVAEDITREMELRRELEREHARFEEVIRDAPAFIATLHGPEHVFEMANPAFRDLLGGRELVGRPVREASPELAEAEWEEILDRVYRTGEPFLTHEAPVSLGSRGGGDVEGGTRFLNVSYIPRREDGETLGVLVLGADVTEQVEARREARRTEELLARVMSTIAEGIMIADDEGVFRYVNSAAARMLGLEAGEVVGRAYDAQSWRITAPDGGAFPDRELPVARVLRTDHPVHDVEHAVERPDGTRILLSVNAAPFQQDEGGQGVVASIRDVTERKEFEAQLEHRALHDYLTDLPNRALLRDRLDHALERCRRTGEQLAVLYLDLDRFKTVNDSLGHEAGDRVLEEIARRLSGTVRDRDTVARVGGDEFIIVLEDVAGEDGAEEAARRMLEAIAAPVSIGTDRVRLDASVGIALHDPEPRTDLTGEAPARRIQSTDLVRRADRAMLQVKDLAGQHVGVAGEEDEEGDEELTHLLSREMRLREAVEQQRIATAYQPIFDFASGEPVGIEALARWTDPSHGDVAPGQFIPLAEETGLIVPLGQQQLERACRDATRWDASRAGAAALRVHVNLSARQLSDPRLLERIGEVLDRTGFPVERLNLEITESAVLREARKVEALKALGVELSVDDFGTRYSTLAQVKRLNVHALKVDRSFVRNVVQDHRDRAIVEATLALGRALGLRVVAEGIETEEQLRLLRELGCHEGQGFGLARPMSGKELARWLAGDPAI